MKKTRYIGISISLAVLLACGLLGSFGKGQGAVQAKDDDGQIEGTWSVIVTPPAGGSARLPLYRLFREWWGDADSTRSFVWAFRHEQRAG